MTESNVLEVPRKRRRFTAAFKARIVEACQQPGASVAGVALEHSLNATWSTIRSVPPVSKRLCQKYRHLYRCP
ncbi:transposase [Cobetia sp. Dlab-2-AX]|uniref:transposase n=1 Tax=unclassified Cobetia TaxID=2609414 RepID=UPI003432394F